MKITRNRTFEPVTIVLETLEDVDGMNNIIRHFNTLADSAPYCVRSVSYTHLTLPTTPYV